MEIWKDIDGYNGKYQVSNLGNVRSFSRWSKGRLLVGGLTKANPQQYRYVVLVGKGRKDLHSKYIHRLVAECFCENPNEYDEVNHIDGNCLNNRADNLEWCTHAGNMLNAKERGVLSHDFEKGSLHPKSKKVLQYKKDGTFVKEWDSLNQIMRETGIPASTIFRVCNPKYKHEHSAKGYIWRYRDGEANNQNQKEENWRQ